MSKFLISIGCRARFRNCWGIATWIPRRSAPTSWTKAVAAWPASSKVVRRQSGLA